MLVKDKLNESLAAFFNQSLCGFIYTTTNGEIIKLNDCIAEWLGYSPLQLVGKSIGHLFNDQHFCLIKAAMQQLEFLPKAASAAFALQKFDGSFLDVQIEVSVLFKNNVADHLLFSMVQIKAAGETVPGLVSEAQQVNNQWFKTIFNRYPVPLAVSILDTGNLEMVNHALLSVTGLTEADLTGKPAISFYSDKQDREAMIKALLEKGTHSKELCLTFKNEKVDCLITSEILSDGKQKKILTSFINITETKNTEKKLKGKQQQLALTHKVARIGDWGYSLKGDKFIFSDEIYSIFGLEPDTFGHTMGDLIRLIHPDDIGLLRKNRAAAYAGESEFNVDHRIILKNGSVRWIHAQAIVEYNHLGEPAGLIGVSQDITERKSREQEIERLNEDLEAKIKERTEDLQRTQQMLMEAERLSKTGSWELDVATNEISWSPEMYSVTGLLQNGIPTEDEFKNIFLPGDWALVQHKLGRAISFAESYEIELHVSRNDGTQAVVKAKGKPVKNSTGRVVKVIGTLADITESKKAGQIIAAQAKVFHAILEQSMAGYWDWNLQTNELYLSPAFKAMFGYKPDELPDLLESLESIVYKDDRELMRHMLREHIDSRGTVPYAAEVRFYHKSGSCIWVICRGALIEWEADGRPLRMVGCHIDITQQKATEQTLEKSRRELEAFSYSVSHDLRAPLRGIDGWSVALLEDYGDSLAGGAKNYIERVREEAKRMNILIDGMLKLAQLNSTKTELTEVSMSLLAENIAARFRETYKKRNINFTIAQGLKAVGDGGLIEILLNNLFENAVKFTARKEVAIIEFGATVEDGKQTFFIRDNGVGFDIASAWKLFGAFQRMHLKKDFEGTGIGLATVQRIINLHNGNVWADSVVNDGAVFYFNF